MDGLKEKEAGEIPAKLISKTWEQKFKNSKIRQSSKGSQLNESFLSFLFCSLFCFRTQRTQIRLYSLFYLIVDVTWQLKVVVVLFAELEFRFGRRFGRLTWAARPSELADDGKQTARKQLSGLANNEQPQVSTQTGTH